MQRPWPLAKANGFVLMWISLTGIVPAPLPDLNSPEGFTTFHATTPACARLSAAAQRSTKHQMINAQQKPRPVRHVIRTHAGEAQSDGPALSLSFLFAQITCEGTGTGTKSRRQFFLMGLEVARS